MALEYLVLTILLPHRLDWVVTSGQLKKIALIGPRFHDGWHVISSMKKYNISARRAKLRDI